MTTALAGPPVAPDTRTRTAASDRRRTRLTAVPDAEPPFDDEVSPAARVRRLRPVATATAALVGRPTALSTAPGPAVGTAVAGPAVRTTGGTAGGTARTARAAGLPAQVGQVGTALARALVEVVTGVRNAVQLRDHCSPPVFTALLDRRVRPERQLAKLQSAHVRQPRDGIAEVAAVFRSGARVRALAFQLTVQTDGGWQITALHVG